MADEFGRLVVVSNRLPVALTHEDNSWKIIPGSGGLVTAMAPALKHRGGVWIGWSGAYTEENLSELFSSFARDAGYSLKAVNLTEEDIDLYYHGFSNEIIWPLFHDFQGRCHFKPEYWRSYLKVNELFAKTIINTSRPSDYIWVHDYHLMHVGSKLKEFGMRQKIGFFLHIPFPSPDIFFKCPWRKELITALMEYDLVGFHTIRDRRNFVRCMQILMPDTRVHGRGGVITATSQGREVRLGVLPISIDFDLFAKQAARRKVKDKGYEIKEAQQGRKIIFGLDRLDYSKGIPQRLESVRKAFELYPDLRDRIHFIQVVVPSRENVAEYQDLKTEIEQLVSQINGEYSTASWIPVHYHYRSLSRDELLAYYRAADIALLTPLKDGMNLVAKEYCASKVRETGVLLLSEFAGAAYQLERYGAVLVNPYDVEGVATALHETVSWSEAECRGRMKKMRAFIKRYDIHWWVDAFLMAAFSKHLRDFPITENPEAYDG